jgi:hypothetical protein
MAQTQTADPIEASKPIQQRVIKVRRDYNAWVAQRNAGRLRAALHAARLPQVERMARGQHRAWAARPASWCWRRWAPRCCCSSASSTPRWAIVATAVIIFAAGLPISVYAAKYGLDMDLLTRGAGFGYIGSTITSLIYASFTFIFFALEAAIMAYALELAFDIPPAWGYLVSALVVIPDGDARRHRHQPAADVDAAAVAGAAGAALRLRLQRPPHTGERAAPVRRGRWPGRRSSARCCSAGRSPWAWH